MYSFISWFHVMIFYLFYLSLFAGLSVASAAHDLYSRTSHTSTNGKSRNVLILSGTDTFILFCKMLNFCLKLKKNTLKRPLYLYLHNLFFHFLIFYIFISINLTTTTTVIFFIYEFMYLLVYIFLLLLSILLLFFMSAFIVRAFLTSNSIFI